MACSHLHSGTKGPMKVTLSFLQATLELLKCHLKRHQFDICHATWGYWVMLLLTYFSKSVRKKSAPFQKYIKNNLILLIVFAHQLVSGNPLYQMKNCTVEVGLQ